MGVFIDADAPLEFPEAKHTEFLMFDMRCRGPISYLIEKGRIIIVTRKAAVVNLSSSAVS